MVTWSPRLGGVARRRGPLPRVARRRLRPVLSDFTYSISCEQPFFVDEALEGRHDRLEAGRDLRRRIQDRLAEVRFVDDDRLAGLRG